MGAKYSDKELVEGLLCNNTVIIEHFFLEDCDPLFRQIKYCVCKRRDIKALVNDFYIYLQEDDWHKLREFDYRIKLSSWISTVATRFFIKKQMSMMKYESIDALQHEEGSECDEERILRHVDVNNMINMLPSARGRFVLRKLALEEMEPQKLAGEMKMAVGNLYNIKHRAIDRISQIVRDEKCL